MLYLRKINQDAWFMGQELDSDSISDLQTQNHEFSVWEIPDDRSNLDDVVLALALTRDDPSGKYIVFLNLDTIKEKYCWDIPIQQQPGLTLYKAKANCHVNLMLKDFWEQGYLAEHIFNLLKDTVNYCYYSEMKLIELLYRHVQSGLISESDLASKGKWNKAYKIYKTSHNTNPK